VTRQALDAVLSDITPGRIRALVKDDPLAFRVRGRVSVPVYSILRTLLSQVHCPDGEEYQRALACTREAVVAAVRGIEGAVLVPGT
jgi:hypothetical protein